MFIDYLRHSVTVYFRYSYLIYSDVKHAFKLTKDCTKFCECTVHLYQNMPVYQAPRPICWLNNGCKNYEIASKFSIINFGANQLKRCLYFLLMYSCCSVNEMILRISYDFTANDFILNTSCMRELKVIANFWLKQLSNNTVNWVHWSLSYYTYCVIFWRLRMFFTV